MNDAKNILNKPLKPCNRRLPTGYKRDGNCFSSGDDYEFITVCIQASQEFLDYSKTVGNDLTEANFQYNFYGLKPKQFWCISAEFFIQAHKDGMAPKINLEATHDKILDFIDLETIKSYAL
jgi:uncharacterized protein (DUF2237 family)